MERLPAMKFSPFEYNDYRGAPTINSCILPSVISPRCRKTCWSVGCQVDIFRQFEEGNVVWKLVWSPVALMDDGVQGQHNILSAWKFIQYSPIELKRPSKGTSNFKFEFQFCGTLPIQLSVDLKSQSRGNSKMTFGFVASQISLYKNACGSG